MNIIGIQVVVYVKTRDNSAEWCSVRGTGPSTEPCGTYESVTLSELLYFLRIGAYFANKKKPNLSLARYSIPIRKSICYCSMVNGVESGRQVKQGQSRNFTLVHTNNDIVIHFQ